MKSSIHIWRKRQDRLTLFFPLIAVALFAALSYWLDARVTESARIQQRATRQAPDHFLENFKLEKTAPNGRIESTMVGVRATHDPTNHTTIVQQPQFDSEPTGKPRLNVKADHAILKNVAGHGGIEQIDFTGTVIARQAAYSGHDAITYESETLTVFPKTQRAQTTAQTRTTSGDRVMVTQGLQIDAETQQGRTQRGIEIELTPKEQP